MPSTGALPVTPSTAQQVQDQPSAQETGFGNTASTEVMGVVSALGRVSVSWTLACAQSKCQAGLNSIRPCLEQQQHMAALKGFV